MINSAHPSGTFISTICNNAERVPNILNQADLLCISRPDAIPQHPESLVYYLVCCHPRASRPGDDPDDTRCGLQDEGRREEGNGY
ncbi:hypothetical protein L0665_08675 [Methanogenium marinum]|uniref:Uncharacterized protein n=1 Tax=Methanogenium marinum TaxID=348610 RepID=A0A9Q4KV11_9EURY|nr:hypothetical protein [Methanogenium marinum]MDE4908677.1 hypothetical protein [Methanogenium marinum]